MTLNEKNIPGRWLSLYRAFVASGSNYESLHDKSMADIFKQMDIIFKKPEEKKVEEPKMTTGKSKKTKLEEESKEIPEDEEEKE